MLNETTGIDYETDRFVIRLVSNNQIINTNALWPRVDGAAINGANPDRAYFKKVAGDAPDADHRFSVSSVSECILFSPALDPADGLPVGEFKPTYTLAPLSVEDLKIQIETQFQEELRKQFPASADPAVLIEAGDALARQADGAQLTAEQAASVTAIKGVGDAVTQLRARQAELNAAAEAFVADPESEEGIYDITAGWTIS